MLLCGALAASHCARGVTTEDLIAEAGALRLRYEKAASERALSHYLEAVAVSRAGSPRDAARAAQALGATYHELGRLAESRGAYAEALVLAERSGDRLLQADIRGDLGFAQAWVGDRASTLDEAEEGCRNALTTAEALGGLSEQAKALVCLGEVLYSRGGNFEPALAIQQRAESLWEGVGDRSGVGHARLSQGYLYTEMRRFGDARAAFESARSVFESIGNRRGQAITLVAEARLLERRGEYLVSLQTYERALELLMPMGDAVWQGSCLAGQATIYQFMADHPRALTYFERALQVAESSGQKVFAMDMLMALGNTHLASGDDSAALGRFEQAFDLASELGNQRWQAWTLKSVGMVHLSRHTTRGAQDAQESFERSLGLLEGLDEKWLEAQVLGGLGETAEMMGQPDRAHQYFTEAWAASRDAEDRVLVAKSRYSLGALEARRGRYTRARADLDSALSDYEGLFGTTHPLVAQSKAALAGVDFASGRATRALVASLQAEATSLEHLRFIVRYLPERQALAFAGRRPRGLDLAVSAASVTSARHVSRVYDMVIQSRGVVLDELAARGRLAIPSEPGLAALRDRTNRARQRFANLLVRSLEESVPQDQLDEARREKEAAERELASQSAEARAEIASSPAGLDAVRRALPDGAVLVSFIQYERHLPPAPTSPAPPSPVPSFAAFVTRAGSAGVTLVRLGTVSEIERLIAGWRDQVAGRALQDGGSPGRAERSYREAGDRLRRLVWDPLAAHVRTATRVFLVPDGALSLVSFDGLPVGQASYVLEQSVPIHYVTAERDLVSARERPANRGSGMLALGGPAFDDAPTLGASSTESLPAGAAADPDDLRGGRTACGSLAALVFQPLDGTLQETREVSRLWPAPLGAAHTLIGREASERAFKQDAGRYRVLHVATHGFFLDGACLPGSARPSTRGVGGLSSTKSVENPLRLSGLALAGANRRAQSAPDEDDGILTAEEVAAMDLQGVEWAVLSACDTGVGEIKAGEGVFGLRRAFQMAGTRTVVMSLWSVDDQATRAWMRALYEGRFQEQLPTADAVHQASLKVLRDRRAAGQSTHPFYWAAFVAAGDWR